MSTEETPLAKRIEEIEVTAVDGLARIRREREVLEGRLEALDGRRDKVSQAVYDRVRGDYQGRLAELDKEAQPLGEEARREYAKLEALRQEVEQAEERVRLDKEEVELRHELGELGKKEFESRAKDCEARLEERRGEREKVETLRNRFLEAVRSEEELLQPAPEPPRRTPAREAAKAGAADPVAAEPVLDAVKEDDRSGSTEGSEDQAPAVAADEPQGAAALPTAPPDAGETEGRPEATVLLGTGAGNQATDFHDAATGMVATVPPLAAGGVPVGSPGAPSDDLAGATRILSRPRMVLLDGDEPGESFFLGPKTVVIGRAAGNAIQLLEEAISRRHAEVKAGPEGFVLEDLGSENGTYVNGERIQSHPLREGDVVQIGPRRLVFREA